MQSITYETSNIHPIFNDFDRLYSQLSVKEEQKSLIPHVFSDIFTDLWNIFVSYGHKGDIQFTSKSYPQIAIPKNTENNMIVCFSGGKDSIAVTKYYLDQGKNVYLYHLKHINQALHDEYKYAQEIADYLDVPLFIDNLKLSGHHDYIEHPMKNMIIVNRAIQYGILNNIGVNIATGNYQTSTLDNDNFEFCGGDDMEMWDTYNAIIQHIIPDFEVNIPLETLDDTLEAVCYDRELLDMSVSCLGRASMRNYWHDWVFNKYGITIPKHRCGRCYKCCLEYIYMADNGLNEYNEDYYRYCFTNLRKNVQREDSEKYTNREVWEHFFAHSMESSSYFENHRIRNYHMSRKTDEG